MRKFIINVNGNAYEVEVEEVTDGAVKSVPKVAAPTVQSAPKAAPVAAAKPVQSTAAAGKVTISSPMPGTVLDIRVSAGEAVKKGQILLILEAMKMENEIMAAADGVVASVVASKGASVNTGDVLITLN